jgi:alpha-glucosidase (family GH31 glycosyl hydrolase)
MQAKPGQQFIVGALRVQVLSESLVRVEQMGPNGFEDRPSFHVVWRPKLAPAETINPVTTVEISLEGAEIIVQAPAKSLQDVSYSTGKSKKKRLGWPHPNSVFLPAPSETPDSFIMGDTPRIFPPAEGSYDLSKPNSGWDVESDAPDAYLFFPRGDYATLRKDFLTLTGPTEMPPLYAFGLIQSRYHPYSQADVVALTKKYKDRGMPLSIFVIDTDWRVGASHGYGENTKLFPDFPKLFSDLRAMGVRSMFNDHPEPQAKTALSPAEIRYRTEGLGQWLTKGLDSWWYDRNWMVGLVEPIPGLRKEVWGMDLYRRITLQTRPNQRPLVMSNVDGIDNGRLNRPPNIAAHRYAIQWTGDTDSTVGFLKAGIENAVLMGVVGLHPYLSEDLGGHMGNPDPEQYVRWMQFGALSPTMRIHSTANRNPREPWEYGSDVEDIVRDFVHLRYALMPTIYTSARKAFETGEPIIRRCDLEFPSYKEAKANDQYLVSDSILVAPATGGEEWQALRPTLSNEPWTVEWFDNDSLSGKPVLIEKRKSVGGQWGTTAPVSAVKATHYSSRWKGKITIPKGKGFELAAQSDDGVRVYVDGKLCAEAWVAQFEVIHPVKVALEGGKTYEIVVEHMQLEGGAMLALLTRQPHQIVKTERKAWLPPGEWLDPWTGLTLQGPANIKVDVPLHQMPVYLRQGSLIAHTTAIENLFTEREWKGLQVLALPSETRASTCDIYDDDRLTNDYVDNKFSRIRVTMSKVVRGKCSMTVERLESHHPSTTSTMRVVVPEHFSLAPGQSYATERLNPPKPGAMQILQPLPNMKSITIPAPKDGPVTLDLVTTIDS